MEILLRRSNRSPGIHLFHKYNLFCICKNIFYFVHLVNYNMSAGMQIIMQRERQAAGTPAPAPVPGLSTEPASASVLLGSNSSLSCLFCTAPAPPAPTAFGSVSKYLFYVYVSVMFSTIHTSNAKNIENRFLTVFLVQQTPASRTATICVESLRYGRTRLCSLSWRPLCCRHLTLSLSILLTLLVSLLRNLHYNLCGYLLLHIFLPLLLPHLLQLGRGPGVAAVCVAQTETVHLHLAPAQVHLCSTV